MNARIAPLALLVVLLTPLALTATQAHAASGGSFMDAIPGFGAAKAEPAAPAAAGTASLVDSLVSQLGVTPQQATGGAGALLSQAQQAMSAGDWSQVAAAIPNVGSLLSAAPALGGSAGSSGMSGLLGQAGAALGSAQGMAALAPAFQSLGLDPTMVSQFAPVILGFVESQAGQQTMSLLGTAFSSLM